MSHDPFAELPPMTEEEISICAERVLELPDEHAAWVTQLLLECRRSRSALLAKHGAKADSGTESVEANLTQVVLDASEWLRTLWDVGYMGARTLPVPPRTHFPQIEVEDILKSVLFTRIRHGKHPLPFPPPTRWGSPWHELVESNEAQSVDAEIIEEDGQPAFAIIDGCNRWRIVGGDNSTAQGKSLIIQHAGKGPHYRLTLDAFMSTLQRLPPDTRCQIKARELAGLRTYTLEWKTETGKTEQIPLRAATREGAEAAAGSWIARHHPAYYGRVGFEHT